MVSLLLLLTLAGLASAAPVCPRTVTLAINGAGSSIQGNIQRSGWIPKYTTECREIGVTYEAIGSGAGIELWNGAAGKAETSGAQFIATDDPLNAAQIAGIETGTRRAGITMIPVAQAAVSVIINLPIAACRIGPGGREIRNRTLEEIWKGAITRWEQVEANCRAGAGREEIIPIVRLGVSGTTAQFKHYLWLILRQNIGATGRNWLNYAEATENRNWPIATIRRETAEGGGQLVREVNANRGSIGYANYADALGVAGTLILKVQNNGKVTGAEAERVAPTYAEPEKLGPLGERTGNANCLRTVYFNGLGISQRGEEAGERLTGVQIREPELRIGAGWERIFGSNPEIRGEDYPICTLTWDVPVLRNATVRFRAGTGLAVRSYMKFIIEEGLTPIERLNYSAPPAEFRAGNRTIVEGITE